MYRKGIKRTDQLAELGAAISAPSIRVAGMVVDTVDEIVHGAVLGKRGIAAQIESWCESGFVDQLFSLLLDKGFHVYLTADHGNVEAVGQGRPNQGWPRSCVVSAFGLTAARPWRPSRRPRIRTPTVLMSLDYRRTS
jgi:hypothetical protein